MKQYVVQKLVMADSVEQAIKKAKKIPIHEVFLSPTQPVKEEVSAVTGFQSK